MPVLASPSIGSNSGSLGGKWEVLGVGSDLFRTIVKYGWVNFLSSRPNNY
jgi:hypothetical protein